MVPQCGEDIAAISPDDCRESENKCPEILYTLKPVQDYFYFLTFNENATR